MDALAGTTQGEARMGANGDGGCVRVVIADDDPFARRVIRSVVEKAGMVVMAEATNGREAVELSLSYRPDAVLMDTIMPELDGIAAIRRIVRADPGQRVVMLTGADDDDMAILALRAGAAGYLTKHVDLEAIPRAVHSAVAGEAAISRRLTLRLVEHLRRVPEGATGTRPVRSRLTSREWEVLDLLSAGHGTDEIARTLVVASATVRSHLKAIYRKLDVRSRAEAVAMADRLRDGSGEPASG
jgi:two-component system, NarL family, response regulator LiaR